MICLSPYENCRAIGPAVTTDLNFSRLEAGNNATRGIKFLGWISTGRCFSARVDRRRGRASDQARLRPFGMTRKPADVKISIPLFLRKQASEKLPWSLSDRTEKSNCNQNLFAIDERKRAAYNKRASWRNPSAACGKDMNKPPRTATELAPTGTGGTKS